MKIHSICGIYYAKDAANKRRLAIAGNMQIRKYEHEQILDTYMSIACALFPLLRQLGVYIFIKMPASQIDFNGSTMVINSNPTHKSGAVCHYRSVPFCSLVCHRPLPFPLFFVCVSINGKGGRISNAKQPFLWYIKKVMLFTNLMRKSPRELLAKI